MIKQKAVKDDKKIKTPHFVHTNINPGNVFINCYVTSQYNIPYLPSNWVYSHRGRSKNRGNATIHSFTAYSDPATI
jgi:hypothetical protein